MHPTTTQESYEVPFFWRFGTPWGLLKPSTLLPTPHKSTHSSNFCGLGWYSIVECLPYSSISSRILIIIKKENDDLPHTFAVNWEYLDSWVPLHPFFVLILHVGWSQSNAKYGIELPPTKLNCVRDERSDLRSSPAFFLSFLYQLLISLADIFDHFKIRICFAIAISTAIGPTSYLLGYQCRRLHVFLAIQNILFILARISEELWTDHCCYCKKILYLLLKVLAQLNYD